MSSFPGLITIRPLQNDFFFLECVDSSLKKVITKGCLLFFQGSSFNFINWKPGFIPANHRFEKSPVWLSLVGLPSKFWFPKALVKIGDALGTLVGIEEDFLKGLKGDVANIYVEIDLQKGFYSVLEIISDMGRWKQRVQRLGKQIPGKCILWNQLIKNSSIAASTGAIHLTHQFHLRASPIKEGSKMDRGQDNPLFPSAVDANQLGRKAIGQSQVKDHVSPVPLVFPVSQPLLTPCSSPQLKDSIG